MEGERLELVFQRCFLEKDKGEGDLLSMFVFLLTTDFTDEKGPFKG